MSSELKELLQLIIPNFSEDNTDFGDISDYIKKLGANNLEHALKEPALLNEEKKMLTEQTQELAFTNYKTFVDTADTSQMITKDFSKSKQCLDKFLTALPAFIEQCEEFSASADKIVKEKSGYGRVRAQSERLLEVVELPLLMREALAADDYESALDLVTFVRNLQRHCPHVPLVQNTTSEIMTLWFETLYRLFNQLRYDLPLPQCLQIVGYLRRASTVYKWGEEAGAGEAGRGRGGDGLHLHFLKARSACFNSALSRLTHTHSSESLCRRAVELHRTQLFSVVTQHKAMFVCDARDLALGPAPLSSWLKYKISELENILKEELPKEEEATLESLFNQCMYLCVSFGRVGADMRCVLAPLFRRVQLRRALCALRRARDKLAADMALYRPPSGKLAPRAPAPHTLLHFYPLAEYCNALLAVLNSLRVIAPLNLVREVYGAFRESLCGAAGALGEFHQREQQALSEAERHNWRLMCASFSEELVPHVLRCLSLVFPAAAIADHLGVTLSHLQQTQLIYIDSSSVCEPLDKIAGLIS